MNSKFDPSSVSWNEVQREPVTPVQQSTAESVAATIAATVAPSIHSVILRTGEL